MQFSDEIHNYYEKLVADHLKEIKAHEKFDDNDLADLSCLILNKLPSRYIRHEVDMAFYLPSTDRMEMLSRVQQATSESIAFLGEHKNS